MKISIRLDDRKWIIAAIAEQWKAELARKGHEVTIDHHYTDVCSEIYIHFTADSAQLIADSRNFVFVTHIDFYWKILNCISLYRKGAIFLCMSRQTEKLLRTFIPDAEIFTITPKSLHFDALNHNEKITFGLFFRLYLDDRKNSSAIENLIDIVIKNNTEAKLIIYGAGFDDILKNRETNSITYDSTASENFDVNTYKSYLSDCHYVVYLGRDEGAISVLDAATLGIPVLATDQGYHRDLPLPVGSLLLDDATSICNVVSRLLESHRPNSSTLTLNGIVRTAEGQKCNLFKYYLLVSRSIFLGNPFYVKNRFTRDRHYKN